MAITPHDRLFKKTLAITENAEGALRVLLPGKLAARVDWSTLKAEAGSFVDSNARHRHSDLLFSARVADRDAFLYLLFEHQSTVDPWMPLRMLVYMGRIWTARREDGAARIPVIIPLVLHHDERGWTASKRFVDLLDADAQLLELVRPYVPSFELLIDDLARVPESELLERSMTAMARLAMWAMRAQRLGYDPALLHRWVAELRRARASSGTEALEVFFVYLSEVDGGTNLMNALLAEEAEEDIREVAMGLRHEWEEQARRQEQKKTLSLRKEWEEQARRQEREKVRQQERAEVLVKLLGLRFGELSESRVMRVRSASVEDLDLWIERIVTAKHVDDVLR